MRPEASDRAAGGPPTAAELPRVSVIIPTRHRADLVPAAVRSVLAQSLAPVEAIVVVDGPDPATVAALGAIDDPRLRVLPLPANRGAAAARMAGVAAARADWLAFLDDDDAWEPGKLAAQMAAAERSGLAWPIVSCRCAVHTAQGAYVWPRRLIAPGEPIADYLFVRRTLYKGETFAPTSTLLFRKGLIEQVPFEPGVHDDWDWLIRCDRLEGCGMVMIDAVACRHRAESGIATLSDAPAHAARIQWALAARAQMSPRAFAGLLLQTIGGTVEARASWACRWELLQLALRHGRPSPMSLLLFTLHSVMPVQLRRRLRPTALEAPSAQQR
jgi:hypothetical protein